MTCDRAWRCRGHVGGEIGFGESEGQIEGLPRRKSSIPMESVLLLRCGLIKL